MYSFFVPVNVEEKLSTRFTVRLVPAPVAEDAPTLRVHWLFCSIPDCPMGSGPIQLLPSSLIRYRLPALYIVPHEPGQLRVLFRIVCTR